MEAVAVTLEDVTVAIQAVGTVRASEIAEIRSQAEGVIAEIHFEEGATVEAGELLVKLDDRKPQASKALAAAAVDRAKARLNVERQRRKRHEKLIEEELISEETYEEAEAAYLAAEADLRETEAALRLAATTLEDFHIRAPFAGRAGAQLLDVGNYIEKGMQLTSVMKTDPLEVEFGVPDRNAASISPDTSARIKSGQLEVVGAVRFIDPHVDATNRLLKVTAEIPNPDGGLRPGQFVEVTIVAEVRRNRPVIPEQAIIGVGGQTWVFVVDDGTVERRAVGLGTRLPRRVEILEGVAAGETIVISGQHRLNEGDAVEIVGPEPEAGVTNG